MSSAITSVRGGKAAAGAAKAAEGSGKIKVRRRDEFVECQPRVGPPCSLHVEDHPKDLVIDIDPTTSCQTSVYFEVTLI